MLLSDINANVRPTDCLYHLGDWSFGGQTNILKYRHMIQCQNINIVLGNHDHWIERKKNELKQGVFNSIRKYYELDVEGVQIVLSHYPIESWNNMDRGAYHLHGHVHGSGRKMPGRYDVGYEAHWLVSLDALRECPVAESGQFRHKTIHGGNKFGESQ
jgi:calcineurin-like phosphoesterase family protein